ncbi:nuclear transport factor 2 family protein [Ruegeria atlantica]|uniref:nuclear transport factor 2 family protein n=1 Tax=Ruegeria atlantica TaxID=81569 RepID=UPI001480128D|nr:nuclear transport factor 2 family protein [Ruegeria atlantica]
MNSLPGIIQTYIDAYNRMDVAAMLACLSDDVTFSNISGGEVTAETSGKQAFAELASFGIQAFASRHQKVVNVISVVDTTLIEVDYSAVVAVDLPNGWKAGQNLQFRGGSAFRIAGGLVVSIVDQSGHSEKTG